MKAFAADRRAHAAASHARSRRLTARNLSALYRYVWLRLRYRNLGVGVFFVDRGADIIIGSHAQISFGHGLRFMRDFTGHIYGRVTIGDGVFFNRGCHVVVHEGLSIGNHCLFGELVSIHDDNHIPGRGSEPIASRGVRTAPITIGDNVWVGAKATVLPGVSIGDNAVIGANAVVTRDIPANTIAVGIPARVVREL